MADQNKSDTKKDKTAKPAKRRGNERPAWAMHDNPGNPGKGPGGRKGSPFIQRTRKATGRGG